MRPHIYVVLLWSGLLQVEVFKSVIGNVSPHNSLLFVSWAPGCRRKMVFARKAPLAAWWRDDVSFCLAYHVATSAAPTSTGADGRVERHTRSISHSKHFGSLAINLFCTFCDFQTQTTRYIVIYSCEVGPVTPGRCFWGHTNKHHRLFLRYSDKAATCSSYLFLDVDLALHIF